MGAPAAQLSLFSRWYGTATGGHETRRSARQRQQGGEVNELFQAHAAHNPSFATLATERDALRKAAAACRVPGPPRSQAGRHRPGQWSAQHGVGFGTSKGASTPPADQTARSSRRPSRRSGRTVPGVEGRVRLGRPGLAEDGHGIDGGEGEQPADREGAGEGVRAREEDGASGRVGRCVGRAVRQGVGSRAEVAVGEPVGARTQPPPHRRGRRRIRQGEGHRQVGPVAGAYGVGARHRVPGETDLGGQVPYEVVGLVEFHAAGVDADDGPPGHDDSTQIGLV